MLKTLQKHGEENALIIDKSLQEALGITPDTPLQLTVSGNALIVTPANDTISDSEVLNSIAKLRPRYKQMLENLAK